MLDKNLLLQARRVFSAVFAGTRSAGPLAPHAGQPNEATRWSRRRNQREPVLLALFASGSLVFGTTYYVSPGGSSGNTGLSTSSPWTMSYALSQAGSSDTVVAMSGTYSGGIEIGTSGLTLKSQTKWGARIVGGNPGIAVYPAGTHNVTIDGFEITGASYDGIWLDGTSTTVRNCWVHDNAAMGVEGHLLGSSSSVSGTIVEYCLIEHNGSDHNLHHGVYLAGTNVVVRSSVLRYNAGAGIQFAENSYPSSNLQAYDNLSYGNYHWQLVTGGVLSGCRIYVYHNTFVGTPNYAIGVGGGPTLLCTNNILVGGIDSYGSGSVVGDYNVLSGTSVSGSHNVTTSSPGFVKTSSGLYWLTSGSPARGMALASITSPLDFFGASQSTVSDAGAFQYNTSYAADTRVLDPSTSGGADYWLVLAPTGGSPSISVSPSTQNFGVTRVGTTVDRSLTVKNSGTGTLTGGASVSSPFSIVSGASYSLTAGQSQTVTVRFSPSTVGSSTQTVNFSGGGGAQATVSGSATNVSLPPAVSTIVQTPGDVDAATPGLQAYSGTTVQYSGSASDPNGSALTWQWLYTANGGSETVAKTGSGSVTPVSFSYPANAAGITYIWKLRVNNGSTNAESDQTVGVEQAVLPGTNVIIAATAGVLTQPFTLSGTYISQSTDTELTNGGTAIFNFSVPVTGDYVVQALVNAPTINANSFFVNVDSQPTDPDSIWDIPPTSGFEQRLVSWRGNGTDGSDQFTPQVFSLAPGAHQLIIVGREHDVQLQQFSILQLPQPPTNIRVVAGQ